MTEAFVLALSDFALPFVLETDASGVVIGVFLMQSNHPIAFFNKKFFPCLACASTYIRELHVITSTVKKWRQYLLGHPFVILTNHKSLKDLMTSVYIHLNNKFISPLMGYDYSIQYHVRRHNMVVDALSCLDDQCLILFVPQFAFFDKLRCNLSSSEAFQNLVCNINGHPA